MADTPSPVPQVVTQKHHRTTLIIAIIVVVVVIMAVAGGAIWLLRRNQAPSSAPIGNLPTGASGQPNVTTVPTPATSVSPLPNRSLELAAKQNNLVVTITYTSQPQFKLSVANIERTYQVDPRDLYAPVPGSPYSTLKVYDTNNNVILERPFAVTTAVIAEGEGGTTGGQTNVTTSQAVLNLPMPDGVTPQKVEIVSTTGQLFDTRSFVFDQLPVAFDAGLSPDTPASN